MSEPYVISCMIIAVILYLIGTYCMCVNIYFHRKDTVIDGGDLFMFIVFGMLSIGLSPVLLPILLFISVCYVILRYITKLAQKTAKVLRNEKE